MRTTALKLPISPLDNRNGRCADSNQPDRHSGFSLCMVRCTTSSEWVVT